MGRRLRSSGTLDVKAIGRCGRQALVATSYGGMGALRLMFRTNMLHGEIQGDSSAAMANWSGL